ncbi:MAG: CPBP family intramembrane metalloprotease [Cyanothece sp. SIO1E1]|nr:CPBP family intramembrane metalloprotease [Cyanothece sp. SIO1E1]
MTLKRFILAALTLLVALLVGSSLISSWNQPQVTDRLQLYQTDILLQAAEWEGEGFTDANLQQVRSTLLGADPLKTALKQYQQVRQSAQENLNRAQTQLEQLQTQAQQTSIAGAIATSSLDAKQQQLQTVINQLALLIQQLDLRLGVLKIQQNQPEAALKTWNVLVKAATDNDENIQPVAKTARVLIGLWSKPPRVEQNAEQFLQDNLQGWFRYQTLARLYQLQQRQLPLAQLNAAEQVTARQTLFKLLAVGILPTLGCIAGVGLILFVLGQRLIIGEKSLLAQNANLSWSTPWNGEIVWQVLIVGFFFVGQVLLPLLLAALGIGFTHADGRGRALYALSYYLLMASGGILVLYGSIKSYLPLPGGWFQFKWRQNWLAWGLGGYFSAVPLMILVSLVNQKLWQGQGGSNPLLQTVLEEQDQWALAIFFLTAAVAAPLFEEILFRGFLLPSLTRYLPVGSAIFASSLLFAVAHLSLSEVLPLTILGMVLGIVYTRSRNLLAPIMLHSLWNSATMVSLFILGSNGT